MNTRIVKELRVMAMRFVRRAIKAAMLIFACVGLCSPSVLADDNTSVGLSVDVGAPVKITRVYSFWDMQYDFNLKRPGPIYFNDCLEFLNGASSAVTHVQFVFALVNNVGEIKRAQLPLDIRYRAEAGSAHRERVNCRDHVYANGDGGYWLAAWVTEVDFGDGTSWTLPANKDITGNIIASIPDRP